MNRIHLQSNALRNLRRRTLAQGIPLTNLRKEEKRLRSSSVLAEYLSEEQVPVGNTHDECFSDSTEANSRNQISEGKEEIQNTGIANYADEDIQKAVHQQSKRDGSNSKVHSEIVTTPGRLPLQDNEGDKDKVDVELLNDLVERVHFEQQEVPPVAVTKITSASITDVEETVIVPFNDLKGEALSYVTQISDDVNTCINEMLTKVELVAPNSQSRFDSGAKLGASVLQLNGKGEGRETIKLLKNEMVSSANSRPHDSILPSIASQDTKNGKDESSIGTTKDSESSTVQIKELLNKTVGAVCSAEKKDQLRELMSNPCFAIRNKPTVVNFIAEDEKPIAPSEDIEAGIANDGVKFSHRVDISPKDAKATIEFMLSNNQPLSFRETARLAETTTAEVIPTPPYNDKQAAMRHEETIKDLVYDMVDSVHCQLLDPIPSSFEESKTTAQTARETEKSGTEINELKGIAYIICTMGKDEVLETASTETMLVFGTQEAGHSDCVEVKPTNAALPAVETEVSGNDICADINSIEPHNTIFNELMTPTADVTLKMKERRSPLRRFLRFITKPFRKLRRAVKKRNG